MEKPPFQFGLKGMFAAIAAAAMLLAGLFATDPGVQLVSITAILWLFWAAVIVACAFAFSVAIHQAIRLLDWSRNRFRAGSRNRPPGEAVAAPARQNPLHSSAGKR